MKKIIKLLIITILLITNQKVKAGENDSNIKVFRHSNIYGVYVKEKETQLFYGQVYSFNTKTSYCLEPGLATNTNRYSSTTKPYLAGINTEKIEMIKKYAYFGYDYKGHNNEYYYFATQELIWEYLTGNEIYWVTEPDINGPKIDIENQKQEIQQLVELNKLLPSFSGQTIKLKIGQTLTLKDTNNVLKDYNISSNIEVTKNNNELTITSPNIIGSTPINLTQQSYLNRKVYYYYYNDDTQKLFSSGDIDLHHQTLTIETIGGSLEINKLDKETNKNIPQGNEASLKNAEYQIFDENHNLITKIKTDNNGITKTDDILPFGNYYIKEITPSIGYELDNNIYNFSITQTNLNPKINTYSNIIKRDIEIYKYIKKDNKELVPEENTMFDIYDNNLNYIKTITTNKLGLATTNLVYGTYIIKEKNNLNEIKIIVNNNSPNIIKHELITELKYANLKIHILEKNTNNPIKNSSIYLYDENDNLITKEISNDKGLVIINKLKLGKYKIKQIDSQKQYNINQNILNIYLINQDEPKEITIFNELKKGILNLTVKDKFNNPLNNIEIQLYNKQNDLIYEGKTNKEGNIIINDIDYGDYYIIEKEDDSNDKLIFNIKENNEIIYLELIKDSIQVNVPNTNKMNNYKIELLSLLFLSLGLKGLHNDKRKNN